MKKINWKRLVYDLFIDSISGLLIGIGIYNFAANAEFPFCRNFRHRIDLLPAIRTSDRLGNDADEYSDRDRVL